MKRFGFLVVAAFLTMGMGAQAGERPVVVVFDIEKGPRVALERAALNGLADYIGSRLTESGAYLVVPRDQLKRSLLEQKKESYKQCYDQSCQIEIGLELAAEKTLSTKIARLGKRCTVTLNFFDLRKSASEGAATQHGGCSEDEVVTSVDRALAKLLGSAKPEAGKKAQSGRNGPTGMAWVHSQPAGLEFTKSEITVAQYRACVRVGKCQAAHFDDGTCWVFRGGKWGPGILPESFRGDSQPVVCIDWNQANAVCEWAGGRLPTEQEWQAEASNKGSREYPWGGEEVSCERAIWGDGDKTDGCGRDSTWPVCSKPRGNSVSGLCDMAGNVWEWTSSLYDNKHDWRVVRGGSWGGVDSATLRASDRGWSDPTLRLYVNGVRCVRAVEWPE